MSLRSLRIGLRLTIAFGSLSIAVLALAGFGVVRILDLKATIETVANNRMMKMEAESAWRDANLRVFSDQSNVLLMDDPVQFAAAIQRIAADRLKVKQIGAKFDSIVFSPAGQQLLKSVQAARDIYRPLADTFDGLLATGDRKGARTLLLDRLQPATVPYEAALSKFVAHEVEAAHADTDTAVSTAERGIVLLALGTILVVLYSVAANVLITRSITQPIRSAIAAADAVRAGNLEFPITPDGADEPGHLLDAMADMQSVLVRLQAAQDEMSRRNDSGELDFRMDATQFEGAYRALLSQVNDLVASHIAVKLRIVEVVSAYATGDFSVEMDRLPGQKAQITTAIDGVKASFQAMSSDVTRLVGAAVQGDFFARGDVSRYQNEFHKMVSELNRLMETTEGSLSDTGYVLEGLAKGDLTRRVTKQYQGGFGLLSTNANLTSDRLADMVEQIRASVETINVAAQEIAAGNLDLSSRTEEQAASLEETAAGMGQLAVTVKQNVGHAQEAHRLATEAGDAAFAGAALATQFNETMGRISTSATNIAGMTGLIDSIAFQTNILALNAAIEAARAGTQGNGFAVIAAEVRALSQRSTEAAKQIEKMVDESRMCANEGVTLADSSGRSMTAIINASVRVVDILSEVTGAASEQSSGIEQVNQAILQMDHVTQQNAALVEEAAAAAASLEAQAGDLDTVMRGFKLDRDTSRSTEQASPPLPSNIQLPSPVPLPIPSAPEALGFPSSNRIQRIG